MLLINEHLWYHVTVRQVSENITKGSKSNTAQEATAVAIVSSKMSQNLCLDVVLYIDL